MGNFSTGIVIFFDLQKRGNKELTFIERYIQTNAPICSRKAAPPPEMPNLVILLNGQTKPYNTLFLKMLPGCRCWRTRHLGPVRSFTLVAIFPVGDFGKRRGGLRACWHGRPRIPSPFRKTIPCITLPVRPTPVKPSRKKLPPRV